MIKVLTLKLNRPEVLNAMNADLILGLLDCMNDAKSDKQVRAIIITGSGRGFCSGADLVDGGWPKTKGAFLRVKLPLQIWKMPSIP